MDSSLEKLQRALGQSLAELPGEDMTRHEPGKWSIAEVLEHLYLTYTATTKGFERVCKAGASLATTRTWTHRLGTVVLLNFGHFPRGRKSPPQAQPRGLPVNRVCTELIDAIRQMDEAITRAEDALGRKNKLLDHPVLGPLSGAEWRKFHLVHGRHHLKQIRSLQKSAPTS
jgi:Protein of unknown function (DUF1569)